MSRVLPRVRDIRRGGAAAIDLVWCACGRYDAYYERGVHRWDVAAGSLIARRAGLEVREMRATGGDPAGVVVAPAALIDELGRLVVVGGGAAVPGARDGGLAGTAAGGRSKLGRPSRR